MLQITGLLAPVKSKRSFEDHHGKIFFLRENVRTFTFDERKRSNALVKVSGLLLTASKQTIFKKIIFDRPLRIYSKDSIGYFDKQSRPV